MQKRIHKYLTGLACCGVLILAMGGCKPGEPTPTAISSSPSSPPTTPAQPALPASSPTPAPTDIPLAARVNGFEITLAEFQVELSMYQSSKGNELSTNDEKRVLDELVDQALLANAAEEKGFSVDDSLIEERINALAEQMGGIQALSDWKDRHGYDEATFRQAMSRSIASAWMRDQIAASVPKTAEQVHARQILLFNSDEAADIYAQLQAGNSFENLALKYDPVTGGELGWFPKGYLPDKEIEQAAFDLQPEQYSTVIQTPAGYHILQLLERNPARPLSPDALLALQIQAVADWIAQQRGQSQIEIFLPK